MSGMVTNVKGAMVSINQIILSRIYLIYIDLKQ
jgi:hypothetical protein